MLPLVIATQTTHSAKNGDPKDLSNVSLCNMHGGFVVLYSAYISHVFNILTLELFAKLIQLKFEPLHCYSWAIRICEYFPTNFLKKLFAKS